MNHFGNVHRWKLWKNDALWGIWINHSFLESGRFRLTCRICKHGLLVDIAKMLPTASTVLTDELHHACGTVCVCVFVHLCVLARAWLCQCRQGDTKLFCRTERKPRIGKHSKPHINSHDFSTFVLICRMFGAPIFTNESIKNTINANHFQKSTVWLHRV